MLSPGDVLVRTLLYPNSVRMTTDYCTREGVFKNAAISVGGFLTLFLYTRICALLAAIISAERCSRWASASIVSLEIEPHGWGAQTPDAHVRPSRGRPRTAGRGHHGAREPGCRSANYRNARRSPGRQGP